jgi:hypothetical protein
MNRCVSNCPLRAQALTFMFAIGTACSWLAPPVLLAVAPGAHAQAVYPTPDAAANALVDALVTGDPNALKHVMGRDYSRLIPMRDIDENDIYDFLGAWAQTHEILRDTSANGRPIARLAVGKSGWTLPVPLVQTSRGWQFDTAAGKQELLTRRIGRNERAAMMTSLAYLDAQNDYRNLTGHYAQRLISTPGQRDGLYWPAGPGEPKSPLGPLAATMPQGATLSRDGYYGYRYRILTAQGAHATGGPQSYVLDGVMTKGCALVAWPAQYGTTGVMSFIVNQDGQLYQMNLGPQTARIVAALKSFDPGPSWSRSQP